MGARHEQAGSGWRRLRPWTLATFVVLLVATGITATVIVRIADEQEQRLLEERSSEAALFVESTMREIGASFPFLAGLVQLAADPDAAFALSAGAMVSGPITTVGMVEDVGTAYQVVGLAGDGPAAGDEVDGEHVALLARAQAVGGLVTEILPSETEGRRIGFAYAAEGLPVMFFLELVFDAADVAPSSSDSPFSDLGGAVYVGSVEDDDHLVFSTQSTPLPKDAVRTPVMVGADEWLLVTTTRESLVGPLADQTRWGVLGGGTLLALITAMLVEILSRRRAYALRLVDERTADLQVARLLAEDANRSKSEFLSRMSHELRTPLNAVLGFGQLLELEDLRTEQQESVDQILKAGRHLLDLINEVLDISRIEAGELSLSPEPVHVVELVQEAVDLIRPLADQGTIQMVIDRSGVCDRYVYADRQRVKQILLNLLSNAVKYNRPRGTVAVSCEGASDGRLQIRVTDTGLGIPAERRAQLFTAFERLGAEHTGVEGTGIGLALSQRLAEVMGGRLDLETTVGQGSTFFVELPLVEGPVERFDRLQAPALAAPPVLRATGRPVVLHIEDNLANLRLIERILEERDVEVVAAMQGRLGLELAREHQPAIVLLDLHLADMGGEQVLRWLRDDPATARIPVVIVSADATPGQVQRLLTAGASGYLTKPLDVRQLLGVVDDALTRWDAIA